MATTQPTKYITCITRMLLNSHNLRAITCPGEPSLYDTHCTHCYYWEENWEEAEEDLPSDCERSERTEVSEDD